MPVWILLSLLFPALTGFINILDKLILVRHSPRVSYYAFWIGIFELAIGSLTLGIVVGFVGLHGLEASPILGGMLTGVVTAVGLLLYLAALRLGQVARVVPIWYLSPLIVAPMAAWFLGESLSGLAVVAILLAVSGAVLVSWQGSHIGGRFGNPVPIMLALGAAAFMAGSFVLNKRFVEGGDFWQFYGAYRLGIAPGMLWVALLPGVRHAAIGMARNRGFMGLVLLAEGIISLVLVVRFAAVELGDVSLVAAISAVQPALVFIYSLVLVTLYPAHFQGWVTRSTLLPQFAGIAVITAAVVIISLL